MTVSALTLSPLYPAAGAPVTLAATSDTYADEDVELFLTAVPSASRLALGRIVENHPTVTRTGSVPLVFHPAVTLTSKPAFITRTQGSFVADGFAVGAAIAISGTASNDRQVTLAAVSALALTLAAGDVLVSESVTAAIQSAYQPIGNPSNVIAFDVPGEYTVSAREYFVCPAIGAFPGDPLGVEQKILKSTASFTVNVGANLDLPIAPTNGHASTLRITVIGDTVRAAALVEPATELARVAALDSTVAAAVSAMVGVAVNSLDEDFITSVNNACTAFAAHIILVGGFSNVHNSADATNTLLREAATNTPTAIARLNDWAAKMIGHNEALSSGGTWHNTDDTLNTLQVAPIATNMGEAVVLKADLRNRVYRRHIAQIASPAVHDNADSTNTLAAPAAGTLSDLFVKYLDFIADETPSAAAGESEGIADAQAAWGFRAI